MLRRTVLFLFASGFGLIPLLISPNAAQGLTGFSTPVVTNLVDIAASVTWVTDQRVPAGTVNFGQSKSSLSGHASENGVSGALGDVHSVPLSNLVASTVYYYSVSLGGYTDDNGGAFYSFKTGPPLTFPVPAHVATGKVLKIDGSSPAVGVLVTLKIIDNNNLNSTNQSAALSALTDSSGNWTITLNARTADSSAIFNYPTNGANDFVQYSVTGGSLGQFSTQTVPMTFNGNTLSVGSATLVQGVATETPVPMTQTLTPTVTLTTTPVSQPTATPSLTPVASPTATGAPPTVAPSPTLPPSATPLAPAPAVIPPTEAPPVENPTDTPADAAPVVPSPAPPAPAPAVPTPHASETPTPTVSAPTPQAVAAISSPSARPTLVPPRPFAVATVQDSTPAVPQIVRPVATVDASPSLVPPDDPGPRPTIALLAGLVLVVAGIAVVSVGVVNQMREY